MSKRTFLMKAHHATAAKINGGNWLYSIKLDGMDAFWDGGATRGMPDIIGGSDRTATGLYTINGNILNPPDWWINQLPPIPLHGQLWFGVNTFQKASKLRAHNNPAAWVGAKFMVYDFPSLPQVFVPGRINPSEHCDIMVTEVMRAQILNAAKEKKIVTVPVWFGTAQETAEHYHLFPREGNVLDFVEQRPISNYDRALEICNELVAEGHEGLMFRKKNAEWQQAYSWNLLKLKPFKDDEGIVIGFVAGDETDRGSRNRGMAGALILDWNGKQIKVSGLRDDERLLEGYVQSVWDSPGESFFYGQDDVECPAYPKGTRVSFKYMTTTEDGNPREAKIWRKRPVE